MTPCAICGATREVEQCPEWLVKFCGPWCFDCFVAWYDHGKTNLDEVRAKSRELQAKRESEKKGQADGNQP